MRSDIIPGQSVAPSGPEKTSPPRPPIPHTPAHKADIDEVSSILSIDDVEEDTAFLSPAWD
jgi:hypothetical protein